MYQETSIASHQQIAYQRQKGCQQQFKSQKPNTVKQIGWKERNGLTLVLFIVLILNEHIFRITSSFRFTSRVKFFITCSVLIVSFSSVLILHYTLMIDPDSKSRKMILMKGDLIWYLDTLSHQRSQFTIDSICFC